MSGSEYQSNSGRCVILNRDRLTSSAPKLASDARMISAVFLSA